VTGLAPQQEKYRILVVDDIADSRLLLVKLLSSIGFVVQEAANGYEAVTLWEQWHPHLIFMDMRMPLMDGYQATRLIRSRELAHREQCTMMSMATVGATLAENCLHLTTYLQGVYWNENRPISCSSHRHTIIIALTANAFEEQREAMITAGCDDLINKPFQKAQILEKLSQYLGVQYIYQKDIHQTFNIRQKSLEKIPKSDDVLSLLYKVPQELVAKIYKAAAQGSDDLILDLIQQLTLENTILQEYFSCLAHNFQFEKIMELTNDLVNQEQKEVGEAASAPSFAGKINTEKSKN
jgi:two-component system sensor histidine kinase/response regulator